MAITPTPTAAAITLQPLSFPALTFAKLAPHAFLHAQLTSSENPTRPSGRKQTQSRTATVHTGSLSHANGSAVIRVGDTATVCGIRAEVLLARDITDYQPRREAARRSAVGNNGDERQAKRRKLREDSNDIAHLNLLVPNLELATGCSPAHMPGGPPSALAQTLSQRLLTLLHMSRLVDMDELRIWYNPPKVESPDQMDEDDIDEEDMKPSVKAFWTLYIDVLFISLDGNPFDAAWGAILAALGDVRLPKSWWDADRDMVLCDADAALAKPLTLRTFPIAATFAIFDDPKTNEKFTLADPDGFEESLCDETITVVLGEQKYELVWEIVAIEKIGGISIGVDDMRQLVTTAQEKWLEWGMLLRGELPIETPEISEEMAAKARKRKETEERVRIKMEQLGMPPLKKKT